MPDRTLAPPAPYIIRGAVWAPASEDANTSPTDPNNAAIRRPAFCNWYETDATLLKDMNVDDGVTDEARVADAVELYKNHPAIATLLRSKSYVLGVNRFVKKGVLVAITRPATSSVVSYSSRWFPNRIVTTTTRRTSRTTASPSRMARCSGIPTATVSAIRIAMATAISVTPILTTE